MAAFMKRPEAQHGGAGPFDHRLRKEVIEFGSLLVCGVVTLSVSLYSDC